mmetsp:Transcript_5654/g.16811  ORF Transcript_5654/g.16811 Transcript_5654/m.16811 type:complete len:195 (+) Transcript_5654:134-718(+)|eukprot:CAMPEP_0198729774 /NCGR_PEP_ID=MMETSP1475-20131203/20927_1 /TAXON_ID= ORGANISM="Unidentified sp., Strain CCMP1999" /NCGR_SAMPLE_ID=MMETSP1475 /ASSEMBLY_ACC=CAM_ASM_001111 /LENGTH=194 /DNA_ID=CAMNT_0044492479 /DNA_START=49 /DNA_END=633 /DNA_ORIENTATION=-
MANAIIGQLLGVAVRFLISLLTGKGKPQKPAHDVDVSGQDTATLLAQGEKLRDDAGLLAHKRNECFEQSRAAYANGDGARAKELSNQGKEYDAEMDRLNARAAEIIFAAKQRDVDPDEIDLHGLYVSEAVEKTKERLIADRAAGKDHVVVIYGAGSHSVGGIQKIKPAVIDLLNADRFRYDDMVPNHGCVTVHL